MENSAIVPTKYYFFIAFFLTNFVANLSQISAQKKTISIEKNVVNNSTRELILLDWYLVYNQFNIANTSPSLYFNRNLIKFYRPSAPQQAGSFLNDEYTFKIEKLPGLFNCHTTLIRKAHSYQGPIRMEKNDEISFILDQHKYVFKIVRLTETEMAWEKVSVTFVERTYKNKK